MVAAQLREEGDGLLRALRDEFAEQPRQGLAEGGALVPHVGREEVAGGDVGDEPQGVEPVDQVVRAALRVEGVTQNCQRVAIVESHAIGV